MYKKGTKNHAVLALLNSYKNLLDPQMFEGLIEFFDDIEEKEKSYWYKFGFKYFSLIAYKYKDDLISIKDHCSYINNQKFIEQLLTFVYKNQLEENKEIVADIQSGMKDGVGLLSAFLYEEVDMKIALIGMEYLADYVSVYDKLRIGEGKHEVLIQNEMQVLPLSVSSKFSFGVVYPWPGMNTAETELLARIGKAADNIGFNYYMLSDFGHVLDENQLMTEEIIDGEIMDFVMTTHYESHKSIDAYYYHLLWNPPDIPLNTAYYDGKVVDNYLMNDDFLIYDFGGMSNHLKSILVNKPRSIKNASTFVGSFPKSEIKEPNLENPKLFYCGMNWEKAMNNDNRHKGLFELLDKTGKIKFFGPDKVEQWGGIRPWEGYDCYQYSIPFDGFSILNEINNCGICLAISSDAHRRAGAVTNRAYEACAAGAVIISDNNIFMEEHFKDSVLYITYNKNNPEDTYKQIMDKYEWIIQNKQKALEMAKRSQQIFVDKFCMEKGLLDVTRNHYDRFKTISDDLFAHHERDTVLITNVLNTQNEEEIYNELKSIFVNIKKQYYRNCILAIACDATIADVVEVLVEREPVNAKVFSMELFDEKGARQLTDGQAIRSIQNKIDYTYYVNVTRNETWFYDHITTLVRSLQDNSDSLGAYAGALSEDENGIRRTFSFEKLTTSTIYLQEHPKYMPAASQFMFKKKANDYLEDFVFDYLDGLEHSAYVNVIYFKLKKELVFTKRMTCVWKYQELRAAFNILEVDKQIKLIRGMVKYDLPAGGIGSGNDNQSKTKLEDLLILFPIKHWLRIKLYRILRRMHLGFLINSKYEKVFNEYKNVITSIQ